MDHECMNWGKEVNADWEHAVWRGLAGLLGYEEACVREQALTSDGIA